MPVPLDIEKADLSAFWKAAAALLGAMEHHQGWAEDFDFEPNNDLIRKWTAVVGWALELEAAMPEPTRNEIAKQRIPLLADSGDEATRVRFVRLYQWLREAREGAPGFGELRQGGFWWLDYHRRPGGSMPNAQKRLARLRRILRNDGPHSPSGDKQRAPLKAAEPESAGGLPESALLSEDITILPVLTNPTAKAVLRIIQAQKSKGLLGKEIVAELAKEGIIVAVSTLRKHYLPKLTIHGVKNSQARGGYYDSKQLEQSD